MNSYKKYALLTILYPLVLFALLSGFMLLMDPLQLFHRSLINERALESNMRQQAAGIINSFDFDSVILGNSYMENTSSELCETLFGGSFVNLSLGGSSNYERSIVLEYALKKHPLRTVITVVDTNTNRTGSQSYPFELWGILYDDNRWNDITVYLDPHYIQSVFMPARKTEFGRPNAWHKDPWYTSRLGGIDKWIANHKNRQIAQFLRAKLPNVARNGVQVPEKVTEARKQEIRTFIAEVMGEQAGRYPQTRFIYIFPPFSRLFYAVNYHEGKTEYYFWHEAMLEAAEKWPNLEVYVFADKDYVDDLKNYIDPNHFDEWINQLIMEDIVRNQGRLTRGNLLPYIQLCLERARQFDLQGLAAYVAQKLPSL